MYLNLLNAELNPICHLLALLAGATIVVVSRLRVKQNAVLVGKNCPLTFSCMSVCPSGCVYQCGSHWMEIREILY
jgi:hypothetical protein